jgi:hypothetical protein
LIRNQKPFSAPFIDRMLRRRTEAKPRGPHGFLARSGCGSCWPEGGPISLAAFLSPADPEPDAFWFSMEDYSLDKGPLLCFCCEPQETSARTTGSHMILRPAPRTAYAAQPCFPRLSPFVTFDAAPGCGTSADQRIEGASSSRLPLRDLWAWGCQSASTILLLCSALEVSDNLAESRLGHVHRQGGPWLSDVWVGTCAVGRNLKHLQMPPAGLVAS